MQKTAKKVSLSTKNRILSQLLAIASAGKLYLDDKFALKSLCEVVKKQRSKLKKARVLLDAEDKQELLVKFSSLARIITQLIKEDATMFVSNVKALDSWIRETELQRSEIVKGLEIPSTADNSTYDAQNDNKENMGTAEQADIVEEVAAVDTKKIMQEVSK